MHHLRFKQTGARSFWSYAHLINGRVCITVGIINGGLGFMLAQNTHSGMVAYAVVAALMWFAYVVTAIIGELRRNVPTRRGVPKTSSAENMHGHMAPGEMRDVEHRDLADRGAPLESRGGMARASEETRSDRADLPPYYAQQQQREGYYGGDVRR